jgi:hypothetical protein
VWRNPARLGPVGDQRPPRPQVRGQHHGITHVQITHLISHGSDGKDADAGTASPMIKHGVRPQDHHPGHARTRHLVRASSQLSTRSPQLAESLVALSGIPVSIDVSMDVFQQMEAQMSEWTEDSIESTEDLTAYEQPKLTEMGDFADLTCGGVAFMPEKNSLFGWRYA